MNSNSFIRVGSPVSTAHSEEHQKRRSSIKEVALVFRHYKVAQLGKQGRKILKLHSTLTLT